MEQLTIQSLGFLIGFQENINIIIVVVVVVVIIITIIIIIIVIVIVILACPDSRCESGQTSGSCRNSILQYVSVVVLRCLPPAESTKKNVRFSEQMISTFLPCAWPL